MKWIYIVTFVWYNAITVPCPDGLINCKTVHKSKYKEQATPIVYCNREDAYSAYSIKGKYADTAYFDSIPMTKHNIDSLNKFKP